MKRIVTLSLAGLLATPAFMHVQTTRALDDDSIVLESPVLHAFDGTAMGVNADVIELIGFIRLKINKIVFGDRTEDGSFIGRYIVGGNPCNIKDLVLLEQNASETLKKELATTLDTARKDLRASVEPFMESIRTVKYQILVLIKESCKKRGMDNSILLRWSEAEDGDEVRVFNACVTSFVLFDKFCGDLLNFLGDLLRSCPKAMTLFKIRSEKCQKARTLIKGIVSTRSASAAANALEQKFMRHIKDNHIDKLSMAEITKEKLEALFAKFMNQK